MKLSLKIYNNFSNSRYKFSFITNFKYVYYIIKFYFKNRYYFVFIILNIK